MTGKLNVRQYDSGDGDAVVALETWALGDTATDPDDVPGREDIGDVETAYLEAGGDFVVGVTAGDSDCGRRLSAERARAVETADGLVVAAGGFLPNEAGHGDERTVAGAAELHRMRVAPPCQRRGYGTALLAELEARAAAAGFETVLATTATRQVAAVGFYSSHGYDRAGTSAHGAYELVHFEKDLQ